MTNLIRRKLIDIGANLTDPMFQGIYNGKKYHPVDLPNVLQRAVQCGVDKIIVTGGSLEESKNALQLAQSNPILYTTIGCHPTRCLEMNNETESYLESMIQLWQTNKDKVVAIGEFGLDYDRLQFCPKEVQLIHFERQFELAQKTKLPLFLHCRNAATDLLEILTRNRDRFNNGVVHSFDGTIEEANSFIDLGLHIGLNGCSLKTEPNLEVVSKLPLEKIMIETDCPWCEIKASHASHKYVQTKFEAVKKEKWTDEKHVKGRNEPDNLVQVLEVIAAVRGENGIEHLANTIWQNTERVFFADKI